MAHYAWIDEQNVVYQVSCVDNVNMLDQNGNESEAVGIEYLTNVHGTGYVWVQTSYNNNPVGQPPQIRNYAGIGDVWNGTEFVRPETVEPTNE